MAEQEHVSGYTKTTKTGAVVQVKEHDRSNGEAATAILGLPGRPPMAGTPGKFAVGRSLPGIFITPPPPVIPKTPDQLPPSPVAQQHAQALTDTLKGIPGAESALKALKALQKPVKAPQKPTKAPSVPTPTGKAAAVVKAAQRIISDPNLIRLGVDPVHVTSYKRRNKAGHVVDVRAYTQLRDLVSALGGPDMAAKKGITPQLFAKAMPEAADKSFTPSPAAPNPNAPKAPDAPGSRVGKVDAPAKPKAKSDLKFTQTGHHPASGKKSGAFYVSHKRKSVGIVRKEDDKTWTARHNDGEVSTGHKTREKAGQWTADVNQVKKTTPQEPKPKAQPEVENPITKEMLSNPDTARTRGVSAEEFKALSMRGEARLREFQARASDPTALDAEHWDKVKSDTYAASREPWGGATIDTHTGEHVNTDQDFYARTNTKAWALTTKSPGQDSVSVAPDASQDEFNAAMDQAKERFAPQLRIEGAHLGVFHDEDTGRIDIDPVLVVDNLDDVEAIGAYTHAVGGAYAFHDGDGYWPPYVKEGATDARLPQGDRPVAQPGSEGAGQGGGGGPPDAVVPAVGERPGAAAPGAAQQVQRQAQEVAPADYRGFHQPPSGGVTINDLTGAKGSGGAEFDAAFPDDVYDHPEFYDHGGTPYDLESRRIVKSMRGKPDDTPISVYRAVPKGVDTINPGDWVAISRKYAQQHADSQGDGTWHVVEAKVPANTVRTGGNDIVEFGYWGDTPVKNGGSTVGGNALAQEAAPNPGSPDRPVWARENEEILGQNTNVAMAVEHMRELPIGTIVSANANGHWDKQGGEIGTLYMKTGPDTWRSGREVTTSQAVVDKFDGGQVMIGRVGDGPMVDLSESAAPDVAPKKGTVLYTAGKDTLGKGKDALDALPVGTQIQTIGQNHRLIDAYQKAEDGTWQNSDGDTTADSGSIVQTVNQVRVSKIKYNIEMLLPKGAEAAPEARPPWAKEGQVVIDPTLDGKDLEDASAHLRALPVGSTLDVTSGYDPTPVTYEKTAEDSWAVDDSATFSSDDLTQLLDGATVSIGSVADGPMLKTAQARKTTGPKAGKVATNANGVPRAPAAMARYLRDAPDGSSLVLGTDHKVAVKVNGRWTLAAADPGQSSQAAANFIHQINEADRSSVDKVAVIRPGEGLTREHKDYTPHAPKTFGGAASLPPILNGDSSGSLLDDYNAKATPAQMARTTKALKAATKNVPASVVAKLTRVQVRSHDADDQAVLAQSGGAAMAFVDHIPGELPNMHFPDSMFDSNAATAGRQALETGFWTPTDDNWFNRVVEHETAHAWEAIGQELADKPTVEAFYNDIADITATLTQVDTKIESKSTGFDWWEEMFNHYSQEMGEKASQYATAGPEEFLAENWAEYTSKKNPRPLAMALGSRMQDYFEEIGRQIDAGSDTPHGQDYGR